MSFWLPESTRADLAQDRKAITEMTLIDEACRHYTAELRQIDEDLELVKASNSATLPGLVPGFWHILRKGTPCTILCLEGPNGEFREPGSWMFPWLQAEDMWNDAAQRDSRERQKKIAAARDRERALERDDRVAEFNERWKSATSVSLSVTDLKRPWTARAAAPTGG